MESRNESGRRDIQVVEGVVEAEAAKIARALGAEVTADFGPRDETPLALVARSADGDLVGGLLGASHWRWLYVRQLWLAPTARGAGIGRALMGKAEEAARGRGCVGIYLDTFSEEAARFYAALGYGECGRIEGFPPGHARRYFAKPFA